MNDHDRITRVATGVLCVIQVTVDCFLKNMIPVVYLDVCFCSNRCKLICAMWMDANHHIQPMACYVCGEEIINDYLILLTHLMEKGLKNRKDLIFSSDGSMAIKSAISDFQESMINNTDMSFAFNILCETWLLKWLGRE